ncbi:MAG: hypothetical protein H6605_05650 [Flavobacteriales bacterium]|nr:hypothetical protein [Flavobacteriales bacterium]
MEPNRFLFKLTAIFIQFILIAIVFFPLIYLGQLIKYNFEIQNVAILKVIFLSIAFAMPFAVANAFAFAKFQRMELDYYLKSRQKHKITMQNNAENILNNLLSTEKEKPFWTLVSKSSDEIELSVKSLMVSDKVKVKLKNLADNSCEMTIESKPKQSYLFLDFGRNYRNILQVMTASNGQ